MPMVLFDVLAMKTTAMVLMDQVVLVALVALLEVLVVRQVLVVAVSGDYFV